MPELAIPNSANAELEEDPSLRRILAVRIYPHRSLTKRNFHILMMLFSLVSFATTMPFVLVGAWPIAGFMGLDVLLFYLAFRANFRAARAYEDVRVTPMELCLAKVSPRGVRAEWRFNPSWVRLDREDHEEFGIRAWPSSRAAKRRNRRLSRSGREGPLCRRFVAGACRSARGRQFS